MSHRSSPGNRRIAFILTNLAAVAAGACAFLWRAIIDALPFDNVSGCIMHDLLHIYCPLCGGTRAFIALCRGQPYLSLQYHPLALYFAVGFVAFDGIALHRLLRRREGPLYSIPKWYWAGAVVIAAIVFGIRNIALIGFGWDNIGDLIGYWQ